MIFFFSFFLLDNFPGPLSLNPNPRVSFSPITSDAAAVLCGRAPICRGHMLLVPLLLVLVHLLVACCRRLLDVLFVKGSVSTVTSDDFNSFQKREKKKKTNKKKGHQDVQVFPHYLRSIPTPKWSQVSTT